MLYRGNKTKQKDQLTTFISFTFDFEHVIRPHFVGKLFIFFFFCFFQF